MNKIKLKTIYRVQFDLISPLNIGSGINVDTDRDILKNRDGVPYISGSAIAGVCRENINLNSGAEKRFFGDVVIARKANQQVTAQSSKLLFFDAKLQIDNNKKYRITRRDCVKLDEYKTVVDKAKFDMEILEPGVTFVTYIVENIYENQEGSIGNKIADLFLGGKIYFGSKTMRGYGEIGNAEIKVKTFDFSDISDVSQYLDFDMFCYNSWNRYDVSRNRTATVELGLKLKGGISIRRYTTDVKPDDNDLNPDSEQLTINGKGEEIPVIPGTSWAGAFLHRVKELDKEINWESVFGTVVNKNNKEKLKVKSHIRFSESQIKGSKPKILSRNAIDRFTGGTVNQALFTEKTYYGGTTELKIDFDNDSVLTKKHIDVLAAAIADLHYGYMAVGGLTSIGRGLFEIETINREAVQDDNVYTLAVEALKAVEVG